MTPPFSPASYTLRAHCIPLLVLAFTFALFSATRAGTDSDLKLADYNALKSTQAELKGIKSLNVTVAKTLPDKKGVLVTDGSHYAFLSNHGDSAWEAGDQLEFTGRLRKSPYKLELKADRALKISSSEFKPQQPSILPQQALRHQLRRYHLQFIKLTGRLLSARQDSNYLELQINGHGTRFRIKGEAIDSKHIFYKVGHEIAVTGFLWYPLDKSTIDTPLDEPVVYMSHQDSIEMQRPPKRNSYLSHLSGEIVNPFEDDRLFIQPISDSGLVEINASTHRNWLQEGNLYSLWGHHVMEESPRREVFNIASLCHIGKNSVQATDDLSAVEYQSMDPTQHLKLVRFVGDVHGTPEPHLEAGFLSVIAPGFDDLPIQVILPKSQSLLEKQLVKAKRIQVTGYLNLEHDRVRLHPQYYHQIEVLGEVPWTQTSTFRWILVGLFSLLITGLIMVTSLKIAVNRRTEALDNSLALLNASYDAVQEGICVTDTQGAIGKTNPKFWTILGINEDDFDGLQGEKLGLKIAECFEDSDGFHRLWQKLNENSQASDEGSLRFANNKSGELIFYTVPASTRQTGRQVGRIWVFKDITKRRQLEETLMQAQKMEAVGRLAGGVAHDFNNLLTGIIGNLEVARLDPTIPVGDLESCLRPADQAAKRAVILIKSLLGFSRQETLSPQPNCANETIEELVSFVQPTLDPKISLRSVLQKDLRLASFDSTKVQQVILNMVVNSRDELGADGGDITIRTHSMKKSHPDTNVRSTFVCISVTDDGGGMPPSVLSRVFEPFFTTKGQGHGTGLGLATSYGTIQQLGGWITCDSTVGHGTTFHVYLPAPEDLTETESGPSNIDRGSNRRNSHHVSRSEIEILCVDDEPIVRRVAEGLLKRSGFRVCSATNGLEAIELLDKRSENGEELPDIILSDLTMPAMDGKELVKIVSKTYPDLPVVICSGYLVDLDKFNREVERNIDGFIQKPYESKTMINCIEDIIVGDMLPA